MPYNPFGDDDDPDRFLCPICGTFMDWVDSSDDDDTQVLMCLNPTCPSHQQHGALIV